MIKLNELRNKIKELSDETDESDWRFTDALDVVQDMIFYMMQEKSPCGKCGSTELEHRFEDNSQYMYIARKCGNQGSPGYFFKNCGLDGMNDDEIAILNWNEEQE